MPHRYLFSLRGLLAALFFIACSPFVFSQKISGSVTDASRQPQGFATVTLHKAQDSTLVKGAVCDADGRFDLENMPAGRYFVRAQILGFQQSESEKFDFGTADVKVPPVVLKASSTALREVSVVAQKPLIEVKADKLVFNVDASPTNSGLNALELLRKSPGVSLDQNDNISLKGRQNVMVQINGKLTPMSGQDLAQYLRSLNSSDVETIEIIGTPGAKYDAEGNAGIINLRLRKDKRFGTNGSLSLGFYQGITPKGDASLSLNHRDRKLNLFGSASMYRGKSQNSMHLDNRVNGNRFDQQQNSFWFARPNNARVGADYTLNSRHTIGALVTGGVFLPNNGSRSRTDIGNFAENRVDSLLVAEN